MRDESLAQEQKFLSFIWLGLLSSLVVYGLIGAMIIQPSEDATVPPMMAEAIMAVAALEAVLIFAVLPKLLKPKDTQAAKTLFIIRWALSEAMGLLGLVLYASGGSSSHLWGFIGAGALCMCMLYPSGDALRQSIAPEPSGH